MFTLCTKREVQVTHTLKDGDTEFPVSITLYVKPVEDTDFEKVREYLDSVDLDVLKSDEKVEVDETSLNFMFYQVRTSIKSCKGFKDESGNEIKKMTDNVQEALFDVIYNDSDFLEKVLTAYNSLYSKN